MPTPTYDLIASNVLGSSAASVTFSSIPATSRDLVLVVNALGATGYVHAELRFNSDSGTNYSYVYMSGNGSSTDSSSGSSQTAAKSTRAVANDTTRGVAIIQIQDYSATDKHKTALFRTNLSSDVVSAAATRWANTAAINSIEVLNTTSAVQFAAGSSFYLYGIVS